ncbi:MAG: adenosine deaminase [Thaumarchaeota archaeon]|nr:adenosine deaminase [Nitrososphaerota archaeon]
MSDNGLFPIIAQIPKAELHVHIEGTLEPEMMLHKASKNGIALPYKTVDDVRKAYRFSDLQSFLDLYYLGVNSIVDRNDYYDLAMAYFRKASSQNVRRAEVFFDPQAHTRRGIDFSTVINGLHDAAVDAQDRYGISIGLIMSFLRDLPEESAMRTMEEALQYKKWIIGVGLDSKELGNPPEKFANVFKRARNEGFLAVAHAGEEGPAEYVWSSIKLLKVSRIDHGYHILDDDRLSLKVSQERIPLTACPLSALKLNHIVPLSSFPIRNMMERGLVPTVNSDDPAYFGGYINENYMALVAELGLTLDEIVILAKNSVFASFIGYEKKRDLYEEIDTALMELIENERRVS